MKKHAGQERQLPRSAQRVESSRPSSGGGQRHKGKTLIAQSARWVFEDRNRRTVMSNSPKVPAVQLDRFFTMPEARLDRWRSLLQATRSWEAAANQPRSEV